MQLPLHRLFGSRDRLHDAIQSKRGALYRLALAWCHDAALADDLVQETLLRALDRSAQLREPERLRSWLCSILANLLRDHYRRHRAFETLDELDEAVFADEATPEAATESSRLVARVRAEVGGLPFGQRQVLTLVDLEGCSYAEVSEILAVPIGTVMSRLCRARRALKARLMDAAPEAMRAETSGRKVRVVR
jgi:RNA polymerase sigma-70 factor (ECF subfamily)